MASNASSIGSVQQESSRSFYLRREPWQNAPEGASDIHIHVGDDPTHPVKHSVRTIGESMMQRTVHEFTQRVRRVVNRLGLDIVPFRHTRHPIARRQALFSYHAIDLVLDVGGNVGEYGRFLRNVGYEGRILSFEPAV